MVAETLRYYPSAWFFSRTVTAPVELAGSRLRQGSAVLLSPYLIHHRPDLYPEPELFDVDRWLPERRAALARGAYIRSGRAPASASGTSTPSPNLDWALTSRRYLEVDTLRLTNNPALLTSRSGPDPSPTATATEQAGDPR